MRRPLFRLVYRRVLGGLPGLSPPDVLAERLRASSASLDAAADRAVALHVTLGSSQGFLFGLPGLLLLPLTLPANLAAAAAVQLHMVATLAALAGHDPRDEEVRERCIECLLRRGPGGPSAEEAEEVATRASVKLAERGARWAAERAVRAVARSGLRRVGIRSVPLVGGILGGASDGWVTRSVARCGREAFLGDAA